MKYKHIYFSISGFLLLMCIASISLWGFRIGVDFTGGSVTEYSFEESINTEELQTSLESKDLEVTSIQQTSDGTYIIKFPQLSEDGRNNFKEIITQETKGAQELRFESVGPSVGPELVRKTLYAILISAVGILLWVAYQFKSIKFGASAVLAMLHDSIILIGSFSILGHFFGAEIDFLFASALLTILSFSVHDTIVVYDRIRETQKKFGGSLYDISNKALTETMVRSVNNSMTIIFMLIALILLGGTSIKWFATALLIGTISGTYSSPFVAVPLLLAWDKITSKLQKPAKV